MITAAVLSPHGEWTGRVRRVLSEHATIIDLDVTAGAGAALATITLDMIVYELVPLARESSVALAQVKAMHPHSVTVCVATNGVTDPLPPAGDAPDHWIIVPGPAVQMESHIRAIADSIRTAASTSGGHHPMRSALSAPEAGLASDGGLQTKTDSALYRIIGRMMASHQVADTLAAYCEAVHEITNCVSHCLLWREEVAQCFTVASCEGLPPLLRDLCRLPANGALATWLQAHRGIVSQRALIELGTQSAILRELELCGAVLAIPLLSQGILRGILALGPKAIGEPYTRAEIEPVFVLSASAAAAVRQVELNEELQARNVYIDQVVSSMESGIVTIDPEERIRVCNPYTTRILGLSSPGTVGHDLRVLPAPLGDYLYECLVSGRERTREELTVAGGSPLLRVSTRRLLGADATVLGSMMLIEDISAERELAEERRKTDRNEVLNQVAARFAHELKNPLSTIHTFAELLPDRSDDPEFQRFFAEQVKRDVSRLDDLIQKLVSLSEPQYTTRELVDVFELLTAATERLDMLVEGARDKVVCQHSGLLPRAHVDKDVVAAALTHLMRFAMGARRGKVNVDARLRDTQFGERSIDLIIRGECDETVATDPQGLLDPSFVLDNPDVDLGPSASQRLIEGQSGSLDVHCEGSEIVFVVSLPPARTDVPKHGHEER